MKTIRHLIDKHPDQVGTIVYLIVLGSLTDTYQNRDLTIIERVKIALRAYYFLQFWKDFVRRMGYSSQHILSNQALDISRYVVVGLLQLVIIYRDTFKGQYPLMLWKVGTEGNEHMFAPSRSLVADFNALDWQYMVPKLMVRLRELVNSVDLAAKARGTAYNPSLHLDAIRIYEVAALVQHLLPFTPLHRTEGRALTELIGELGEAMERSD